MVRISLGNGKNIPDGVETILLDNTGFAISGSSVAAITLDDALLVGTVHDSILRCRFMNHSLPQRLTRSWGTQDWIFGSSVCIVLISVCTFTYLNAGHMPMQQH